MRIVWYEDQFFYYVWKPSKIPSTFGKEKSFLELVNESSPMFWDNQLQYFTKEQEWGLVNRLDNDTAGLLYFAKNQEVKVSYKQMQKAGRLKKCYIVEVYGDIAYRIKKYGFIINSPIFHRKDDPQRMGVLGGHVSKEQNSPLLYSETEIVEYEYSLLTMTSMLLVEIRKGVRHQIRVHLSSIGYPIVGDLLYGKKKDPQKGNLQLFSVGLSSIN